MIYTTTLTSKGQVTIPIEIREALNLSPSEKIAFVKDKNQVIVKPVVDFLSLKGSIKLKKKYSDQEADKEVGKFVAQEYEKNKTT